MEKTSLSPDLRRSAPHRERDNFVFVLLCIFLAVKVKHHHSVKLNEAVLLVLLKPLKRADGAHLVGSYSLMHSLNKPFEEGSNSPRVKSMHHYIITLKSSKESFSYMP